MNSRPSMPCITSAKMGNFVDSSSVAYAVHRSTNVARACSVGTEYGH
jgi:hypothetical protein